MGLFDGPSWKDRMLYEAEEQTRAAQRSEKAAKRRAREDAATNAELRRLAKQKAAREASAQRQAEDRARIQTASQQAAVRAAAKRQQEQHRLQAETQQNANWAMFRQTADGALWQRWIEIATEIADSLDGWNRDWSAAVESAADELRLECVYTLWNLGIYLPEGHPAPQAVGSVRMLRAVFKSASDSFEPEVAFANMQKSLERKNPDWASENDRNRRGWIAYAVAQIGYDPLVATPSLAPGYMIDNLNWTVPTKYRALIDAIKKQLPPASEIRGHLPVVRALKPIDTFGHPVLTAAMEQIHREAGAFR